jgi:hypothetical protein
MRLLWAALAAAGLTLAALLPGAWRLRGRRPVRQGKILTLDDAAAACRASGLQGWELATFAQQMVYRKFTQYSVLNLGDTPGRAFAFGMGYCTQYNLALKQLLGALSIGAEAVFCLRVQVAYAPEWRMGHTWLRVTIDDETRAMCAGHADNVPGRVGFTPLAPVYKGRPIMLLLTHLGMVPFVGFVMWKAQLTGHAVPDWVLARR